jgi:hypothetical protein
MDPRTGAEAITTRVGAIMLPLAIVVFAVSTAVHPSGELMNDPLIFKNLL